MDEHDAEERTEDEANERLEGRDPGDETDAGDPNDAPKYDGGEIPRVEDPSEPAVDSD